MLPLKIKITSLLIFFFSLNQSFAQFPDGLQIKNQNLVQNGDFSLGNLGFKTAYKYIHQDSLPFGAVLDEGEYGICKDPKQIHHDFFSCSDRSSDGNMMVVNGSYIDNEVIWSQKIKVKPNTHYVFSCWVASAHLTSPAKLQFSINGINHKEPIHAPASACTWKQFSTLWESGKHDYIVISIVNKNTALTGNDFLLDDITFYECIPPNKTSSEVEALTETPKKVSHSKDLVCGKILILEDLKFHDNSTKFKGMIAANRALFLLFLHLKDHPNSTLTLYGHTDIFGNADRNLDLSKQRVVKIQRWLTMHGIKAHRINYEWFGGTKPLVQNGGISNRRVEIKMTCDLIN